MTPTGRFEAGELAKVEESVRTAEQQTCAELVVVLARSSGSYVAVDLTWGLLAAIVILAAIVHSPWDVDEALVLVDVVTAFLVGAGVSANVPGIRRLLTREASRQEGVRAAAKVAFVDHQVGATRERTGILVFYSHFERALEILPDLAIQGKVPGYRINEVRHVFEAPAATAVPFGERLARAVRALGEAVKTEFPAREKNPNELPDAPRIQG
jgi:putative membrane protein